jgi:beta-mannosidase
MKSYPGIRTLNQLLTDPKERHSQSRTLDLWHMAPEDQRTISLYLNDNFRHGTSLEDYVYTTQLLQAEAMSFGIRAFRRLWRGPGREECAGSLVWQLNDCFPTVSWSLVDNFLRPKLAYHVTSHDYASIVVGVSRRVKETTANEFTKVHIPRQTFAEIWVSNLTTSMIAAKLVISLFSVKGGTLIDTQTTDIKILPNRSAEYMTVAFPTGEKVKGVPETEIVVSARLTQTQSHRKGGNRPLRRLASTTPASEPFRANHQNGTFEIECWNRE